MNKNNKNAAIIGLGYVGLPLAVLAQEKGWKIIGIDINQDKVKQINKQKVPFKDAALNKDLKKYQIKTSTQFKNRSNAAIIIIEVQT